MDSFTNKITLLETLLPDDDSKGYAFDVKIISIPEYLYEFPPFFAHKKVSPRNLSAHDLNQYKTLYGQSFGGSKGETLYHIRWKHYIIFGGSKGETLYYIRHTLD